MRGNLVVPGDKSISHRAIMCGALADGVTEVTNCLMSDDVKATIDAFRDMGVRFDFLGTDTVVVYGSGKRLVRSGYPLNLGNSGTAMRLMAGILSGAKVNAVLHGDHSLMSRPMERIATPLRMMGAHISLRDGNFPPVSISEIANLKAITYSLPVASAQVKSAILFAALFAEGVTVVKENVATRDHTERMFELFGVDIKRSKGVIAVKGQSFLKATNIDVPSDLSSAAFFIIGTLISEGGELILSNVGLNPTRTGVIEILNQMGARIEILDRKILGNEPVGDLKVSSSALRGIHIDPSLVASAIDEFPAVFIAAACAEGKTTLRGAGELRHKETDRLTVMADGLNSLGINVRVFDDGIEITGGVIKGGNVDASGDHRVAMAFAMAALKSTGEISVDNASQISTSFPDFFEKAEKMGLRIVW